jgi:integrase/predicted RNA-binding Zn-ribbon protein involved in translation (DUF1610 family)
MEDNMITQNNQSNYPLSIIESQCEIRCTNCGSTHYILAGFSKEKKQRYVCKDCGKKFVLKSRKNKLQRPQEFNFDDDIWLASHLGLDYHKHRGRNDFLNFSSIQQENFQFYVKKFILYICTTRKWGTITNTYLSTFISFSKFLNDLGLNINVEDFNRELILRYLHDQTSKKMSSSTISHRLSTLLLFFETGLVNNWFQVDDHLIRKEDYPKRDKNLPRYIPEEVMLQLSKHLAKLPEPIMRMVLVIQECGLRVGELCLLPIDCLKQDNQGQYKIKFMRWKMKKEDILPISSELALVIKEQQEYIQKHLGNEYQYLFCSKKQGRYQSYKPTPKVVNCNSFIFYLKRLAKDYDIKDNSGKIWNFQSHQFRHTVGTRMINNGVPQHIIQRYLGHDSPQMTSVYAHIHDHTLRQEIEKYHESRAVNFQGKSIELEDTVLSSKDDLEWFKKNVQARALEHGYCARPKVLGDCDITGFDGCYDCPHWRTNKNFLPILKDTLERTNNVIEKARNCGWELQVKKNEPIQSNLQKVIASLEEEGDE